MRLSFPIIAFLLAPGLLGAQSQKEIAIIKAHLAPLQALSFEHDREYCGYMAYDKSGGIVVTPATRGWEASCAPRWPDKDVVVFASYHTHGSFSRSMLSEFPSAQDMETDEEEGIDGYVSTPGGRLWYIDSDRMEASQLCGIGCLGKDPNFVSGVNGFVKQTYSYREIVSVSNGNYQTKN